MSLLFPTSCILCGQQIADSEGGLCKDCCQQMESDMQTLTCYPPEYVSEIVCAGRYRGGYRAALLRLKYAEQTYRLNPISELLSLIHI